jgi:hypothetical protein
MAFLINPGGPEDNRSIALATSKGRRIPNWQRAEHAPEQLKEAVRIATENHPGRQLRSLTATYNCIGMAFANRRSCVEPEQMPLILRDDEYSEVTRSADVFPGDVVVYENDGEVSHVAVVVSNDPRVSDGTSIIRVISQWGADGEYLHEYHDVPVLLGKPVRFYSERRKV